MNPYRTGSTFPPPPRVSIIGRWLCRRGWHSYRFERDITEGRTEKHVSADLVASGGTMYMQPITVVRVPIELRCRRCGLPRIGHREEYEVHGERVNVRYED